jgi:phage gpG-like protein
VGQTLEIGELVQYIHQIQSRFERGVTEGILATSEHVKGEALKNARKNFTGRNGRTQTGTLMNHIYSRLIKAKKYPDIGLGVKGIPYGAIHEFGTDGLPKKGIVPIKAKYLWIPNQKVLNKKMSPREFVDLMRSNKDYYINPSRTAAMYKNTPFFFLNKGPVKIPPRPYLTPAMLSGLTKLTDYIKQFTR